MGLLYKDVCDNKARLLSLTGLEKNEFEILLGTFSEEWLGFISHFTLQGTARKRKYHKTSDGVIPEESDKLFFILCYLKSYPVQELFAALFEMSQPQANFWIHLLMPYLESSLDKCGYKPVRDGELVAGSVQGGDVLIADGTERRIGRPTDQDVQKEYYSGKKMPYGKK